MSNLSRSGKCVLRNSPKSRGLLDLLIQELQLKDIELVAKKVEAKRQTPEIKPSSEFFEYALYQKSYTRDREKYFEQSHACDSIAELQNLDLIEIYGSLNDKSEIRVKDGMACADFLLYYRSDKNLSYIAVTYSYG